MKQPLEGNYCFQTLPIFEPHGMGFKGGCFGNPRKLNNDLAKKRFSKPCIIGHAIKLKLN